MTSFGALMSEFGDAAAFFRAYRYVEGDAGRRVVAVATPSGRMTVAGDIGREYRHVLDGSSVVEVDVPRLLEAIAQVESGAAWSLSADFEDMVTAQPGTEHTDVMLIDNGVTSGPYPAPVMRGVPDLVGGSFVPADGVFLSWRALLGAVLHPLEERKALVWHAARARQWQLEHGVVASEARPAAPPAPAAPVAPALPSDAAAVLLAELQYQAARAAKKAGRAAAATGASRAMTVH